MIDTDPRLVIDDDAQGVGIYEQRAAWMGQFDGEIFIAFANPVTEHRNRDRLAANAWPKGQRADSRDVVQSRLGVLRGAAAGVIEGRKIDGHRSERVARARHRKDRIDAAAVWLDNSYLDFGDGKPIRHCKSAIIG